MKNTLIALACLVTLLLTDAYSAKADVNQKVLHSFHAVFAKARNIHWKEYSDHYFVSFNQDDVLIKVSYDLSGNIISSMRYYNEQRLPLNILCKVKKIYPSKSVDIVTEINSENGTAYFIQLKDSKGWTIIKSDESAEFEVIDKFKKP